MAVREVVVDPGMVVTAVVVTEDDVVITPSMLSREKKKKNLSHRCHQFYCDGEA